MTSKPADRVESVVESFDDHLDALARLDALMAETREPRSAAMLLDTAEVAGISADDVVLDAGCRDGVWPARLTDRFGCHVIGVDLARRRLYEARERHTLSVCEADVAALPLSNASVDFVWCREVLSLVSDPKPCLQEYRRVLRAEGALISWEAYPTALLSDDERAWFFPALDAPEWWKQGRPAFDDALSDTGLAIESETPVAPESTEWLALHRPDDLLEAIVRVAKMRRERDAYESELGHWYPRMLAWETWPLYLLLGKLQTYALVLRPTL